LQSFVLIIDLGAIIKHDDEKAGNPQITLSSE
jgi:hypothetical protein